MQLHCLTWMYYPFSKTNTSSFQQCKDGSESVPAVGDYGAVALLEGQLNGVIRVIQVKQEESLLSHRNTHLHHKAHISPVILNDNYSM